MTAHRRQREGEREREGRRERGRDTTYHTQMVKSFNDCNTKSHESYNNK